MVKSVSQIWLLAAMIVATTLFGGCENTTPADNPPVKARITSTIDVMTTRAAGTTWAAGDAIGVSGVSGEQPYMNVKYVSTTGNNVFVPDGDSTNDIYFQDQADVDFTAYYPYDGTSGTIPGTDGIISKTITADDQTAEGQAQYDFLFARTTGSATNPNVQFRFRHCMSRVVLNFLPGYGIVSLSDIRYSINTLALRGTFDTQTGAVTGTKMLESITLSVPYDAGGMSSTLIVFPLQKSDNVVIDIIMGERVYRGKIDFPENPDNNNLPELVSGYSYTYNIRINNATLTITPATINEWGDDGSENIDSTNN